MPSLAGLRRSAAAIAFNLCVWRSDAALRRSEWWEDRAAEFRRLGENA